MSSVLSFLGWSSSKAATEPAPASVATSATASSEQSAVTAPPPASSLQRQKSAEMGDDFVLVDESDATQTPLAAQTPKAMDVCTPAPALVSEHPPAPAVAAEQPVLSAPVAVSSSTARSKQCRPYGFAHSPPALLASSANIVAPVQVTSTPTTAAVSAPGACTKRSFASVAAASPVPASSTRSSVPVAYAQDASVSLAEQLRAKIEQLTAEVASAAGSGEEVDPCDYASKPSTSVRLPKESAARYDSRTLWALAVEEPSSKRAKRADTKALKVVDTVVPKPAAGKGKSHKQARKEQKELRRARGDKTPTVAEGVASTGVKA